MIIRLTVNDNDCTRYVERFAKGLTNRLLGLVNYVSEDAPIEEKLNAHRDWDRTFKLINPNCTTEKNITLNDKAFLKQQIKMAWSYFITANITKADAENDGLNYLIEHFDTDVDFHFTDKWENGEAVYYFSTANVVLTQ